VQRLLPLLVLAALAALLAGCGSKKSQPTTTADWANGVCTAIDTWATSIKSSVTSVTSGNVSKSSIQGAGKDMQSATDTLQSDLKALGKPNTQAGQQAKTSIDELSSELKADSDSIKTAVDNVSGISGALSAASTVTTTLGTMKDQVSSTYTTLKQLDATGELKTAFNQSSACTKLSDQLSTLST
jgi:phosphoenolpyruvate-protein kinase (PTS system EI component)